MVINDDAEAEYLRMVVDPSREQVLFSIDERQYCGHLYDPNQTVGAVGTVL